MHPGQGPGTTHRLHLIMCTSVMPRSAGPLGRGWGPGDCWWRPRVKAKSRVITPVGRRALGIQASLELTGVPQA